MDFFIIGDFYYLICHLSVSLNLKEKVKLSRKIMTIIPLSKGNSLEKNKQILYLKAFKVQYRHFHS